MRTEGQKQSLKHENRLAKLGEGSRNAMSGAGFRKGDVRWDGVLIEHKWTGKKQMTVKSDVLEKVFIEAVSEGRTPVLGLHLNGKNYVVLDENDYLELLEAFRAAR